MTFKRKNIIRRKTTIRQMLNNEKSGVPLVHDANYLAMYYSPRSFDFNTNILTDQRSGVTILPPVDFIPGNGTGFIKTYIDADGYLLYSSGGLSEARGVYPKIPSTASAISIMAGRHTTPASGAEYPTMTFRPGAANIVVPTINNANWRNRVYPNVVGDTLTDSYGNTTPSNIDYSREYKIDSPNLTTIDNNNYISIAVLDRTNNLYRMRGYRQNIQIQSKDIDISNLNLKDINFYTTEELGVDVYVSKSTMTISGFIAGYGMFIFPNGLPSDWEIASFSMGLAWLNLKNTFWPTWGKV